MDGELDDRMIGKTDDPGSGDICVSIFRTNGDAETAGVGDPMGEVFDEDVVAEYDGRMMPRVGFCPGWKSRDCIL